jgi:pyruvate/2-oxoglutarate dehydrogenase complex dihydrolipoamide dehydrogenase (E3) component
MPEAWPLERLSLRFETSMPGVFAVGDVRHRSAKRVAAAVGEGAIAIQSIHDYLELRADHTMSSVTPPQEASHGECVS